MYICNPNMIGRRLPTTMMSLGVPRQAWDWSRSPLRLLLDQCKKGVPTVLKVRD